MGKEELLTPTTGGMANLNEYYEMGDDIRLTIKELVLHYRRVDPLFKQSKGGVWENSFLYAGRGTVSMAFYYLNVPYFGRAQLKKALSALYPTYEVKDVKDHGLRVYIK